jgi:4'-phosphopantetheinyl transferase EntD
VVGSITHTQGHCAAVVAPRWRFLGLGLDSEIIADVRPALWAVICVARETAWIKSLPAAHQTAAGALIFAAKEAFYKCQYPLVGERLGFHDLCIEAPAFGSWQGSFTVSATREIAVANRAALPLPGRYRFHDALVSAGVALIA